MEETIEVIDVNSQNVENNQPAEIIEETENAEDIKEEVVNENVENDKQGEVKPVPKKKAGRPKESKDKKPRPSRKKVIFEEPVEEEEEQELPRAIPHSFPIPHESESDKAALMLQLLQHQAQLRKNKKTQLWASWFR